MADIGGSIFSGIAQGLSALEQDIKSERQLKQRQAIERAMFEEQSRFREQSRTDKLNAHRQGLQLNVLGNDRNELLRRRAGIEQQRNVYMQTPEYRKLLAAAKTPEQRAAILNRYTSAIAAVDEQIMGLGDQIRQISGLDPVSLPPPAINAPINTREADEQSRQDKLDQKNHTEMFEGSDSDVRDEHNIQKQLDDLNRFRGADGKLRPWAAAKKQALFAELTSVRTSGEPKERPEKGGVQLDFTKITQENLGEAFGKSGVRGAIGVLGGKPSTASTQDIVSQITGNRPATKTSENFQSQIGKSGGKVNPDSAAQILRAADEGKLFLSDEDRRTMQDIAGSQIQKGLQLNPIFKR